MSRESRTWLRRRAWLSTNLGASHAPPAVRGRVYGPPADAIKEAMQRGNALEREALEGKRRR